MEPVPSLIDLKIVHPSTSPSFQGKQYNIYYHINEVLFLHQEISYICTDWWRDMDWNGSDTDVHWRIRRPWPDIIVFYFIIIIFLIWFKHLPTIGTVSIWKFNNAVLRVGQ